jgi:hypothetical protein
MYSSPLDEEPPRWEPPRWERPALEALRTLGVPGQVEEVPQQQEAPPHLRARYLRASRTSSKIPVHPPKDYRNFDKIPPYSLPWISALFGQPRICAAS